MALMSLVPAAPTPTTRPPRAMAIVLQTAHELEQQRAQLIALRLAQYGEDLGVGIDELLGRADGIDRSGGIDAGRIRPLDGADDKAAPVTLVALADDESGALQLGQQLAQGRGADVEHSQQVVLTHGTMPTQQAQHAGLGVPPMRPVMATPCHEPFKTSQKLGQIAARGGRDVQEVGNAGGVPGIRRIKM